jgi:hypothetical protein
MNAERIIERIRMIEKIKNMICKTLLDFDGL